MTGRRELRIYHLAERPTADAAWALYDQMTKDLPAGYKLPLPEVEVRWYDEAGRLRFMRVGEVDRAYQKRPETIKARAAIAVSPSGDYNIAGWTRTDDEGRYVPMEDDEMRSLVFDGLDQSGDAVAHFITVEVPLPVVSLELEVEVER